MIRFTPEQGTRIFRKWQARARRAVHARLHATNIAWTVLGQPQDAIIAELDRIQDAWVERQRAVIAKLAKYVVDEPVVPTTRPQSPEEVMVLSQWFGGQPTATFTDA